MNVDQVTEAFVRGACLRKFDTSDDEDLEVGVIRVTEETPGQVFKIHVELKLKDEASEWKNLEAHFISEKYSSQEKKFYHDYLPAFQESLKTNYLKPLNVPECYNLDENRQMMILEDLGSHDDLAFSAQKGTEYKINSNF